MRIALLSDIHGNCIALDAVLADIQEQGEPDEYWVLGDLAAFGPQPNECMDRLSELPNVRFTRGNADRYVTKGDRPPPSIEQVLAEPQKLPNLIEVTNSCTWTQGMVTAHGWFQFLDELPMEQRMTLPDGTRLLGVHASPGEDASRGIEPDTPVDELIALFSGANADLICVGHTHWPCNRIVEDVRVVNLGSVSNPRIPSLEGSYVMLDADESGYRVEHRFVAYDRDAVVRLLEERHHPAARFVRLFMEGGLIATQYCEPDL